MILKINTNAFGYLIWDDIYNIYVKRECLIESRVLIDGDEPKEFVKYTTDGMLMEIISNVIISQPLMDSSRRFYTIITASRNNREPFTVIFDTKGWLTNDSGKTIESF